MLDLKWLNLCIEKHKFKMETVKSIEAALEKELMTSIDLSEVYLHVSIRRSHRQFLIFAYTEQHYQYRVLLFGLVAAPRVFTKVLVALVVHFRKEDVCSHHYLDDLLVKVPSREQTLRSMEVTIQCLEEHGWVVN